MRIRDVLSIAIISAAAVLVTGCSSDSSDERADQPAPSAEKTTDEPAAPTTDPSQESAVAPSANSEAAMEVGDEWPCAVTVALDGAENASLTGEGLARSVNSFPDQPPTIQYRVILLPDYQLNVFGGFVPDTAMALWVAGEDGSIEDAYEVGPGLPGITVGLDGSHAAVDVEVAEKSDPSKQTHIVAKFDCGPS